jgi:hypothetical protein
MKDYMAVNMNKEIWRRRPGDYYSPSIHITESGNIGINVGGHVLIAPVEAWHDAGNKLFTVNPALKDWKRNLAYKLMGWSQG